MLQERDTFSCIFHLDILSVLLIELDLEEKLPHFHYVVLISLLSYKQLAFFNSNTYYVNSPDGEIWGLNDD